MVRGDIVDVDLPLVKGSHVQGGRRPAILVIADWGQQGNPMRMIVPLTTNQAATRYPFTLPIPSSSQNSKRIIV